MAATPVTPVAGLANVVVTAGTPVEAVGPNPNGGFITNPANAPGSMWVDPVGAAGTWASGPTYTQLFGPGIKKPGDPMNPIYNSTTSVTTCATNTIAIMQAITPSSAANVIRYSAAGPSSNVTNATTTAQVFRGSTGIGTVGAGTPSVSAAASTIVLAGIDVPNSTSAQTYTVKCSSGGSGTLPATPYGLYILLEEIMSSLELANDNVKLRMVG